jgi:4'-phosphopantetheinyl transferase
VSRSEQAQFSQRITPPQAAEVHVWIADLRAEPVETARRVAATTDVERERASLFWRRADGERYVASHGVLRLLLAGYLGCDPLRLDFRTGEHGKPFLPGSGLEFNLSHSSDLALIAVARERRVGVDVEALRPMPDLEDLAPRVCTPGELVILNALAEPARTHAFLGLWTRKEALAKATGEGIQAVMRDALPDPDRWTVLGVSDLPGYAASVAAEGKGWELVRRNVTDPYGKR